MTERNPPPNRHDTLLMGDDNTLETLRDALDRSNRDLEQLFTLSLDLICQADYDGYFLRVNPAFQDTLGYSPQELMTQPFSHFIHPDDVAATATELRRLAAGEPTMGFVNRYRRKHGGYAWLAWKAAPARNDNVIYAVARDITADKALEQELRDRERQLQGVFDAVADGLITIDADGIIGSFNAGAERIFGWQAVDIVGTSVQCLIPEPQRSEHDDYVRDYLRTDDAKIIGKGRQVTGLRKDGTTFPMDLSVTQVQNSNQRMFVGVVRDLTEKLRLELAANALLARDAFQQGRIDVASGILHDIGNALTGIASRAVDAQAVVQRAARHSEIAHKTQGFLQKSITELNSALGEAKATALIGLVGELATDMVAAQTQTLGSLGKLMAFLTHAQELLTTHRSYSGAGSGPVRETAQVRKFLSDAVLLTSDSVVKRNGTITIDCPSDLGPVSLERSRLMQVLVNLLKNAVEACDSAQPAIAPAITFKVRRCEDGLVIEVWDNGPGFEPAAADQLFAAGFSTKQRGSGTGLGASRRIIEAFGGRLTLHSDGPGRGAVARIQLPIEVFAP